MSLFLIVNVVPPNDTLASNIDNAITVNGLQLTFQKDIPVTTGKEVSLYVSTLISPHLSKVKYAYKSCSTC